MLYINDKIINIYYYKSFFKKFRGLMFKKEKIDYGILLRCNGIHSFFMYQEFDLCVTDKNFKILYLKENFQKNKILLPLKNGYYTLELPLNTVKYLKVNEKLKIELNS